MAIHKTIVRPIGGTAGKNREDVKMGNRFIIVPDEVNQVLNVGTLSPIVSFHNEGNPDILLQADDVNNVSLLLKPKVAFFKLLTLRRFGTATLGSTSAFLPRRRLLQLAAGFLVVVDWHVVLIA